MKKNPANPAFTMIELLIGIAILALMAAGLIFSITRLVSNSELDSTAKKILQETRQAHTDAATRYQDTQWGIKIDEAGKTFTVFGGASFAARNAALDRVTTLPSSLSWNSINLQGGGSELVFQKTTGKTPQYGSFSLVDARGQSRTLTINKIGQIERSNP